LLGLPHEPLGDLEGTPSAIAYRWKRNHASSSLVLRPNKKVPGFLGNLKKSLGVSIVYGARRQASFDDGCQFPRQVFGFGGIEADRPPLLVLDEVDVPVEGVGKFLRGQRLGVLWNVPK